MLHVFPSLTKFLMEHPSPCFLLHEVVKQLEGKYAEGVQLSISDYEYYLKHRSNLTKEEQMMVRQKIMGRKGPQEMAQTLFPVAANGKLPGSIVVTAHMSPDIDTVVSSFNGWMDAFEMDVAENLHRWNVPNDPKEILEVKLLFINHFGPNFFSILSDNRTVLTLTALDLATTQGLKTYHLDDRTLDVSSEESKHACCVVDEEGNFIGGWLAEDVEKVRVVIDGLNHCIRWLQNAFFQALVSKEGNTQALLEKKIEELEPYKEFSPARRKHLDAFLSRVLDVPQGVLSTVHDLLNILEKKSKFGFNPFLEAMKRHIKGETDDLEKLFNLLSDAFKRLRFHLDTFRIALLVKEKVYDESKMSVHPHAAIEEIHLRIQDHSAIFVTRERKVEGVIYASRLRNPTQGSVVLRDFSNPNEIDHLINQNFKRILV